MDIRANELTSHSDESEQEENPQDRAKRVLAQRKATIAKIRRRKQKSVQNRKRRIFGREATKAGMMATLTATALTGFRILKPMKYHQPAGILFLLMSAAHLMLHDQQGARRK